MYSTQRPASLAVLDYLLPKLPNIPKVIVAMVTSNSHNKDLLEKGQELARKWDASFISNTDKELPSEALSLSPTLLCLLCMYVLCVHLCVSVHVLCV